MKKILLILTVLFILAGIAGMAYYLRSPLLDFVSPTHTPASSTAAAPALTQPYQNSIYNFSLMMPADFAATESQDPSASSTTIVMQNTTGDGVQILVSPFDEDTGQSYTLTKERILQDVPDLSISGEQSVVVGANYTGLAFLSDNAAFGGDSREVWFVFRGELYQISTYARLDPLLKGIFATWKFF